MNKLSYVFAIVFCAVLGGCSSGPAIDRSLNTPHQTSRVKYLILHYTVADTDQSIKIFKGDSDLLVSVHYLLTDEKQPKIYQFVDESRVAYHGGRSNWKTDAAINYTSVGIEIVNKGWVDGPNERQWFAFPQYQIDALIPLVKDIVTRHRIPPTNVLGHSDIDPQRKQDPGALFPWKRLFDEGLVAWPDESVAALKRQQFEQMLPDLVWFQRKLADIGYLVPQDGMKSELTRNVLVAFQTKYRPAKITGEPDAETAALLDSPMITKTPVPR
jgi:N-acetylmuramoyl-L-alanine amidase